MWHRVINGKITESREDLPADVQGLTLGRFRATGWRLGTTMPKPSFDVDSEQLELAFEYDRYSGEVTEWWRPVPRNRFHAAGDARRARKIKALAEKDPLAAALLKGGITK